MANSGEDNNVKPSVIDEIYTKLTNLEKNWADKTTKIEFNQKNAKKIIKNEVTKGFAKTEWKNKQKFYEELHLAVLSENLEKTHPDLFELLKQLNIIIIDDTAPINYFSSIVEKVNKHFKEQNKIFRNIFTNPNLAYEGIFDSSLFENLQRYVQPFRFIIGTAQLAAAVASSFVVGVFCLAIAIIDWSLEISSGKAVSRLLKMVTANHYSAPSNVDKSFSKLFSRIKQAFSGVYDALAEKPQNKWLSYLLIKPLQVIFSVPLLTLIVAIEAARKVLNILSETAFRLLAASNVILLAVLNAPLAAYDSIRGCFTSSKNIEKANEKPAQQSESANDDSYKLMSSLGGLPKPESVRLEEDKPHTNMFAPTLDSSTVIDLDVENLFKP